MYLNWDGQRLHLNLLTVTPHIFECLFKELGSTNFLSHLSHWCILSASTGGLQKWSRNLDSLVNDFPHLHLTKIDSLSVKCVFSCRLRFDFDLNNFSQILHWSGFPSECIFILCELRLDLYVNFKWQMSHE